MHSLLQNSKNSASNSTFPLFCKIVKQRNKLLQDSFIKTIYTLFNIEYIYDAAEKQFERLGLSPTRNYTSQYSTSIGSL